MKLKDYQIDAVQYLKEKRKAILEMGCGMGKTIVSLLSSPVLEKIFVVGPPSLKDKWHVEADRLGRSIYYISSFNKKAQRDAINPYTLIIDEAHSLLTDWNKDYHLIHLAKRSKRVYMLTATPLINDPIPLYWMLKLCGENWTKHDFLFKFCGGKRRRDNPKIVYSTKPTNLQELKKIKEKYTFSKNRDLKILKKNLTFGKAPIKTSEDIENYSNIQNILGILKSKDEKILKILKKCLTFYKKCVVFFTHKEVGKKLSKKFEGILIDGDISFNKRNRIFKKFKKGVLFLNSRAVGVGVDIEDVDCVIFIERTWSPFKDYQAYMRCYRMNREKYLKIIFLDYEDEAKFIVGKRKEILKEV